MNPVYKKHIKVAQQAMNMKNDEYIEDDEIVHAAAGAHYAVSKAESIAFLQFYRRSNWLHEFKSDEQLWEDFIEDREKQKGCPFDEPIYNPEKV